MSTRLCRQFARILGGVPQQSNGVCLVTRKRNIRVSILERRTRSPITVAARFSFESGDRQGETLNLGEIPLVPRELNSFIRALVKRRVVITGLSANWLYDNPRITKIHFLSVDPPLVFARAVRASLREARVSLR